MVVFKMYSRFFVVLTCTVQGGSTVDVLLIAFLQLGYGWNFETVYWQMLGRSGKKIILLSSLAHMETFDCVNSGMWGKCKLGQIS